MEETLQIGLEDAASGSWWRRILYTLGSQYGQTQLRFVGKADGDRRLYVSDTFPGPPLGATPPDEQWAPGMEASLAGLRQQLARDGWAETAHGDKPWDVTFTRRAGTAAGAGS